MANRWQRFWPRLTAYVLAVLVTAGGASAANSLLLWSGQLSEAGGLHRLLLAIMADFLRYLPLLVPQVAVTLLVMILLAGWLKPAIRPLAPFAYPLAGWLALVWVMLWLRALSEDSVLAAARHLPGFLIISLAGAVGGLLFALLRKRRLL